MKTRMNRIVYGVVCGVLLLTGGCVRLWQDNLDIKTYVLEASRKGAVQRPALADKLWIDSVVVLPPYNVRNLVLRKNDVEYAASYYTELLMSPAENFRNAFYAWFSDSGIFSTVSMVERTGMSHRLAISVMQFHGDQVEQTAVLKIKVTLLDEKTKGVRVLFTKDYAQNVPLADASAEELIRGYNNALTRILENCEADVINALR